MKKSAFTLIELLAVIAILAILITLGSKGIRAARINAKKAQAMVEIKSIETALNAYLNKYGRFPIGAQTSSMTGFSDVEISSYNPGDECELASREIISILTMANDADFSANSAGVIFLEPQSDGSDGTFLDPWGHQYRIGLDTDYDGQVFAGNDMVRRKIAVVSVGLYILNGMQNSDDLIKSWE